MYIGRGKPITSDTLKDMNDYINILSERSPLLLKESDYKRVLFIYGLGRRLKAKISLVWQDMWVGAFYDKPKGIFYICLFPCIVIKLWWEELK